MFIMEFLFFIFVGWNGYNRFFVFISDVNVFCWFVYGDVVGKWKEVIVISIFVEDF